MAVYEYFCPKCRKEFELIRPMSEAGKPAKCPKCGTKAERLVSGFGSKTGSYLQAPEKPFRAKKVAASAGKTGAAKAPARKTAAKADKGKAKSTRTAGTKKGRKK